MFFEIQLLIPKTSPITEKILLNIAIRAIKTNSIAPTFTAIFIPSPVPIDIAESRLDPIFSLEIFTSFSTISV